MDESSLSSWLTAVQLEQEVKFNYTAQTGWRGKLQNVGKARGKQLGVCYELNADSDNNKKLSTGNRCLAVPWIMLLFVNKSHIKENRVFESQVKVVQFAVDLKSRV